MKRMGMLILVCGLLVAAGSAEAKGCLKGAVVGGVAGHFAGHHGAVGAVAGCIVGRHEANKQDKQQEENTTAR
jgi:outer membrane lipoprotein SlyB